MIGYQYKVLKSFMLCDEGFATSLKIVRKIMYKSQLTRKYRKKTMFKRGSQYYDYHTSVANQSLITHQLVDEKRILPIRNGEEIQPAKKTFQSKFTV